jgi:pSer/pThr/pTyr-binding forkhead associated (FHA) protein
MATLCLLREDGALAQHWEVTERALAVGRGETVDVQINDQALSRRHFLIAREGQEYVVQDLSSRNGTWVRGCRALAARLHDGDWIMAGRSLFRFSQNGVPTPTEFRRLAGPHGTVVLRRPQEPDEEPPELMDLAE